MIFRKDISFVLSLVCLVIFSSHSSGQSHQQNQTLFDWIDYDFQSVTARRNIPDNIVSALAQDQDGFIWIGSQNGLLRYDGYKFRKFVANTKDPSSIAGNIINILEVDTSNRIWIGTESNGLSVYDSQSQQFKNFDFTRDTNSRLSNNISGITFDQFGNALIATLDGIFIVKSNLEQFKQFPSIKNCLEKNQGSRIISFLMDSSERLWISFFYQDAYKMCLLEPKIDSIDYFSKANVMESMFDPVEVNFLKNLDMRNIYEASDGKIWIATRSNSAFYVDSSTLQLYKPLDTVNMPDHLKEAWIIDFVQLNEDELWIATYGEGVIVVDPVSGRFIRNYRHDKNNDNTINQNEISALLKTRSGMMWLGTWGSGLNTFDPSLKYRKRLRANTNDQLSLSFQNVLSIHEVNDGSLWVGSTSDGIDIISEENVKHVPAGKSSYGTFGNGTVIEIAQVNNQEFWIGTYGGLYVLNEQTGTISPLEIGDESVEVFSINKVNDEFLWLGTSFNLQRYDLLNNTFINIDHYQNSHLLTGFRINQILKDKFKKVFWLATDRGVYRINDNLLKIEKPNFDLTASDVENDEPVNSITQINNGQIVYSTMTGAYALTEEAQSGVYSARSLNKIFNRNEERITNVVAEGETAIWHTKGRINVKERLFQQLNIVDEWDVGTIWEGSFTIGQNRDIYYGGSEGLLIIRPSLWEPWSYTPPVVVSDMAINNQPIVPKLDLVLESDVSSFSVEFSALDYSKPEALQYAYRLLGYDENWIYTDSSNRKLIYTNIPPGEYTLEIKSTNRRGVWSDTYLTIPIYQKPTWYESLIFKLCIFLFVVLLTYTVVQFRVRSLKQQKRELGTLVKARTLQLEEKNKELSELMKHVTKASITDDLTKAHNRRFFNLHLNKKLTEAIHKYEENQPDTRRKYGVIMLDIDDFKAINDTYGHTAGDKVLTKYGTLLAELIREEDWLLRWGGEEFLIVVHVQNIQELWELAKRIKASVNKHEISLSQNIEIKVTCSMGVVMLPFIEKEPSIIDVEKVIHIADLAMYEAKKLSKNTWVSYFCDDISNETYVETINHQIEDAISLGIVQTKKP